MKSKWFGSSTADDRLPVQSVFECPSCGIETTGRFCSNCGEKEVSDQDYSLRRYLAEIGAAITLLESKVVRSVSWRRDISVKLRSSAAVSRGPSIWMALEML